MSTLTSDTPDPAYRRLAGEGPHAPTLGGALITWVEPMPEHVVGYNRWYEDDHMITGAMVMPWMFSCRRFVAPRFIQHLRAPANSKVAVPLEAGKYIGLYWVNSGRIEDHLQWSLGANHRLHAEGRGSYRGRGNDPLEERRHIHTAFHDYRGATYRDPQVPRDVHTLVQPHAGLVVELIDTRGAEQREMLHRWLIDEFLASTVQGSVSVALRFDPRPFPPDKLAHVKDQENVEGRCVVLYFLDADPRECWDGHFRANPERIAASGLGEIAVQAAFVPTIHGTDTYTDQLF